MTTDTTRILAIDPGSAQSAWLLLAGGRPEQFGIDDNESLVRLLRLGFAVPHLVVIEQIESYGMPVGREVFDTVWWGGRFTEAAEAFGLHKRAAGFTGNEVAAIFGIDATTVGKIWVRRGLIHARHPFRQGPNPVHLIDPETVERFIVEHPELIDVDKMPPSPYRDLAKRDPWISLAEVHRLTGRNHHAVALLIRAGVIRGRRRGAHWYMPLADVPRVRPLRTPDAIEESWFRRQSVLEIRRNRRKGSLPRLGDGRASLPAIQRIAS